MKISSKVVNSILFQGSVIVLFIAKFLRERKELTRLKRTASIKERVNGQNLITRGKRENRAEIRFISIQCLERRKNGRKISYKERGKIYIYK